MGGCWLYSMTMENGVLAAERTRTRMFIGLPIPQQVVRAVSASFEQYPQFIEQAVPAEKWHLTLLFLGEVDNPRQYYSRLRQPMPQTFLPTVRLTHVGRGRQRDQLWAYAESSQVLLNIRRQVIKRMKKMRFPFASDPRYGEYLPHITVAKLLTNARGIGLADFPLLTSFAAQEIAVYRSVLTEHGSTYSIEEVIPLQ